MDIMGGGNRTGMNGLGRVGILYRQGRESTVECRVYGSWNYTVRALPSPSGEEIRA